MASSAGLTPLQLATRLCVNCEEQCPTINMCPWSKTAMTCHVCKTNYNRNLERMKDSKELRDWWKGLSKEAKVDWFKRNKATYEPNKKRAFDTDGEYQEFSSNKRRRVDEDLNSYLTLEEWSLREISLGRCGTGTLDEKLLVGKKRFEEKVMEAGVAKKWSISNECWLLGVYRGVEERTGSVDEQGHRFGGNCRLQID